MDRKRRPGSQKNPSILSHEFFIQNHADIVSCVAMVIVLGLLFNSTQPLASYFVTLGHNTTSIFTQQPSTVRYNYGIRDLCVVSFYTLICIIMHAVIQECALDKLNRRLHLSRTKTIKFNESGQLLSFYIISAAWGIEIFRRENYLNTFPSTWLEYPHSELTYFTKFFFIIQISYWIHNFPELYFQKIKKEEWGRRITYSLLYLIAFSAAYLLNFSKVALYLAVPHFIVEALFHFSRLFYFADKTTVSGFGFTCWAISYVLVRLYSVIVIVLTFWFGLADNRANKTVDLAKGNFNTYPVRMACLIGGSLVQIYMMWNYINLQQKRLKERMELEEIAKKKRLDQAKKEDSSASAGGGKRTTPQLRKKKL